MSAPQAAGPDPTSIPPTFSIVIPVYNGARTVGDVVERVAQALAGETYEIVLVDDGSADDSWEVITRLSAEGPVRGLRMLKNYGQHAAVVAGLEAARGEWVVTIDDDGENDPAEIPALHRAAVEGGHDLVFAERSNRKAPFGRRMASRIVNGVVVRVFDAPDDLRISNYRLMANDVARRIVDDRTQYPYVNGLALEYAGAPVSVPIAHGERQAASRYTLRTLARLLTNILFSYSIWAYRIVVGLALVAIAASGLFSLVVLFRAALSEATAPGWASLILLFSVMSIANLVALTVIGEYVVRSLRQSRGPSRYIVVEER